MKGCALLGDWVEDLRQTSWSLLFPISTSACCRHSDAQSVIFAADCAWRLCSAVEAEEGPRPRPSMPQLFSSCALLPVGPEDGSPPSPQLRVILGLLVCLVLR